MIVRLSGRLSEVTEQAVVVERDGFAYEVLVPGFALGELTACRGKEVQLHTLEFYEGSATASNLVPRLVGFLHPEDKQFFSYLIGVKGIGIRKALRAFSESSTRIAQWINEGNAEGLASLPGIGSRAAQLIIAELREKVDLGTGGPHGDAAQFARWSQGQRDALEIMVGWGDSRPDAERWLQRAAQLHPELDTPDAWVKASYRIRSGSEG